MIIKRIRIKNYKTYLSLDLDLSVDEERPIVLIGGMNGGGKTTLFEAICGALYGLDIKTKAHFDQLLNDGARSTESPVIELELTFVGMVLNQEQKYILKRVYALNPADKPVESVQLNMNGNMFVYGTATPAAQRAKSEQQVNKIIKANLPQELSKYFLFDAMQSSEMLKENVFAQIIRDNIENVMGFNKYLQLKRASEKLQQERAKQRLAAEQQRTEYDSLCSEKETLEAQLLKSSSEQDTLYKLLSSIKDSYEEAKKGARNLSQTQSKINDLDEKISMIEKDAGQYVEDVKKFLDNVEVTVFLPKLVSDMSNEINQIIKSKDDLIKAEGEIFTPEKIRDITGKILDYLTSIAVVTKDLNPEAVVNYLLDQQRNNGTKDPYSYLNEADMLALRTLVGTSSSNTFLQLERSHQDLEVRIDTLPELKMQRDTLVGQLTGGDEVLIRKYEESQSRLETLKKEDEETTQKITALEKRLHQFDIEIQQQPDVKYDTLVKLIPFFEDVANALLKRKKELIETQMKEQLNELLISYKGYISRVEISNSMENFSIKLFHTAGNEISINQLNTASKQIFIQVLLKVLRNLGDYNPPVMIDTVMGVLDNESRDILMEQYFPSLAEQTILLCTTSEIRKESDYNKLEPFISRSYTLKRDIARQCTEVSDGYFGIQLND